VSVLEAGELHARQLHLILLTPFSVRACWYSTGLLAHPQTTTYYDLRTIDSVQSVHDYLRVDQSQAQCEAVVAPGGVYLTPADTPKSPMTTLLRNVTESTVDAPASAESAAQPSPLSPLLEGTREQASSPPPEDDAGMQGGDGSDGSISAGVARESQGVEVAVAQTANIE